MAIRVKVQVLDVGQGSGNLLEVYDSETLKAYLLIDLGSNKGKEVADEAYRYVVDRLKEMDPHVLDTLIISHSDADHCNRIGKFLDCFDPPGTKEPKNPILTINHIFYGCDRAAYTTSRSTNCLTKAESYFPPGDQEKKNRIRSFPASESSWAGGKWTPFHTTHEVSLFLFIGNALKETPGSGDERPPKKLKIDANAANTQSLVVGAAHGESQCVFTGDATGGTMAEVNRILYDAKHTPADCFMMTVPHHGASRTVAVDLKSKDGGEENLRAFAENFKPQTITISAHEKYDHPRMWTLRHLWIKRLEEAPYYTDPELPDKLHYFTAHIEQRELGTGEEKWPDTPDFYSVLTAANVYSTSYCLPGNAAATIVTGDKWKPAPEIKKDYKPPRGVRWTFTWDSEGRAKKVERADIEERIPRSLPFLVIPPFRPAFLPPRHQTVSPLRHLRQVY